MAIKLKIEGFDELMKAIEKAGKSADKAARECLEKSADIMQEQLKAEMQASGVPGDLIDAMPASEIDGTGGLVTARVGYKKGSYNPDDLSDGYKVLFYNYGTPNRTKHGKEAAHGFIQRAKRKAKHAIRKQQEATLHEILRGLAK